MNTLSLISALKDRCYSNSGFFKPAFFLRAVFESINTGQLSATKLDICQRTAPQIILHIRMLIGAVFRKDEEDAREG